ncbi:hypothetical protein [Flavobacterium sp. MMS24-S5]|uniref:hypothetical protein n=1 Tax=Flavobacterium sp. MMS24-S5 TaxID=3416605 RepID=UPI003CFBFA9E
MELFINESSLHGQYNDNNQFFKAFKIFLSSLNKISEIKNHKEIFKSDYFFYFSGIEGIFLESLIKSNPALNQTFAQNLQLLNPKSWQKNQIHIGDCSYEFNKENFVGTTVAEISERSLVTKDFFGFLLNFSESKFGSNDNINVLKNREEKIFIDSVVSSEDIENWLINRGFIIPAEIYDENSRNPPTDYQTVLKDNLIFEKTNYPKNNGRTVYRKKDSSELWVVDSASKHAGSKAHIEVFDEGTRKHLGTSLYNVVKLNTDFKVDNRKIDLG